MRSQQVCSRFLSRFFAAVECLDRGSSRRTTSPHSIISHPLPYALATAFLVAAMFFLASTASAADLYWSATSGDWSEEASWGGTAPTSSDDAYITNNGTALIDMNGGTCSTLYLGYSAGQTGAVDILSGNFTASVNEYVGYNGTGSVLQTGGTNYFGNVLSIGNRSGSTGTYSLSGEGVLTGGSVYVGGYNGTGRLELINPEVYVKYLSLGIKGTLGLGFDFNTSELKDKFHATSISISGTIEVMNGATATQSSSTYSLGGLVLGTEKGSGSYILSAGQVLSVLKQYVGYSGDGFFLQSGGSNGWSNGWSGNVYHYIGYNAGASGSYTLQSGTHTVTGLYLGYNTGATGRYSLESGILTGTADYIGNSGTGYFSQSGGTYRSNNAGNTNLCVGCNAGSYGEVDQTGGVHTGINLVLGYFADSTGVYKLKGGSISSAWFETIGYYGTGVFIQTGGTHNANIVYLSVGSVNGGTGTYNLSGSGYLYSINESLQNGTFNQSGEPTFFRNN